MIAIANKKQLAILKRGVDVWNKWRQATFLDEQFGRLFADAKGPDLRAADLTGVELQSANLHKANLREANLPRATLYEADLHNADLTKANLMGANLVRANLRKADLSGATVRGANLSEADLSGACLIGADVRKARLRETDLRETDLSWANLGGAEFVGADLVGADLLEVDLSNAVLAATVFGDADLGTVKGLDRVRHYGPSTIGIDSIYKSKGNIPEVFLRGCGVPENFIAFMHSLTGKAFDFNSRFISHSAKDKPFCERLHNDLQAKGVRTWYFPEDAKWGETVWGEIDRGIKVYDKLVVVCSQNSLQSEPVIREIERALNREAKEHKNILFPITLDRYVFGTWEHELKADLLRKVIGEFCEWESTNAVYRKAFERLLKNLRAG